MKNSLSKTLVAFLLTTILFPLWWYAQTEPLSTSPVIQLISYKSIFGNYVEMLGWWSASIITKDGVILSNNHVVDDGKGWLASAFSVCVTKTIGERPGCNYTAKLINRNQSLDLSLLRIDPIDIYGNPVNYDAFPVMDIDFDTLPQTQDDVVAIGYPWVGADTISQTKGIISGTSEYNGYRYLKTDTLIAGGNSGGALINKLGKLIGIPTFTIGGMDDGSLGYALSISQARDFIINNQTKKIEYSTSSINFPAYQHTIETINKNHGFDDDLLSFSFDDGYEIKNYIPGRSFELGQKKAREIAIQSLRIEAIKIPTTLDEKQFLAFAHLQGLYYPEETKLIKQTIGGVIFYAPVSKNDVSNGDAGWGPSFSFARYEKNILLTLSIDASLWDEKNNVKLKEEIATILSKMTFHTNKSIATNFQFSLHEPELTITNTQTSAANDRMGIFTQYLGNLHEYFEIRVEEKTLWSGLKKSRDEIFKTELMNTPNEYKAKISLKGHAGMISCSDDSEVERNSYSGVDENGIPLPEMTSCTAKIVEGITANEQEFFLIASLTAEKKNASKMLGALNYFLENNVMLTPIGNGKTSLVNLFALLKENPYTDLGSQTTGYKNTIRILQHYWLLNTGATLNPNKPMTWGESILVTFNDLYHRDLQHEANMCKKNDYVCVFDRSITIGEKIINLHKAWKDVAIDYTSYVDQQKFELFLTYLELRLSWAINSGITYEELDWLSRFQDQEPYRTMKKMVDIFNNAIYGKRKIGINEIEPNYGIYTAKENWYFDIKTKRLYSIPMLDQTGSVSFMNTEYANENKSIDRENTWKANTENDKHCLQQTNFSNYRRCMQFGQLKWDEYEKRFPQEVSHSYRILTKAELIDKLVPLIDFSLFDPELALKKDTQIEEKK